MIGKSKTIIETTVDRNLCVSCGICISVCPKKCIAFHKRNGQYIPQIEVSRCTKCGVCSEICSAHNMEFKKYATINKQKFTKDWMNGNYISCYNGYSLNNKIRFNSASGGLITTIVQKLLNDCTYDKAFLVEDFNYNKIVESMPFTKGNELINTSKSRYIPISHKKMIEHVLHNKDDKIIIVATSCVVHTFLNFIDRYKLNRKNYLILGLFCERTLSQNVFKYFENFTEGKNELNKLYFRTKENSGWPGNVKLQFENNKVLFIDKSERMKVKDFFQLERCLYCIDKLNQFADISFGDNYTQIDNDKNGSNSIIVRTKIGAKVIEEIQNENDCKFFDVDFEIIKKSQHMKERNINFEFAKAFSKAHEINLYPDLITDLNKVYIKGEVKKNLKNRIKNIEIGRNYPLSKDNIKNKLRIKNLKNKIKKPIKRLLRCFVEVKK